MFRIYLSPIAVMLVFLGCRQVAETPNPESGGIVGAIEQGDRSAIQDYLREGADPNSRNRSGDTALAWAANRDDIELANLLLELGADPNQKGSRQRTSLHWACLSGSAKVLERLLSAGALPDQADLTGATPLIIAAKANRSDLIKALIRAGADVNRKDKDGRTALIHTVLAGHALALESLVLAGADSSIADRSGQTALDHARDLDREWLFLSQGILDKKPDRQQKKKSLAPKTTDNRRDQPEIDTSRLTERVFAKLNEFRTKHGKSNFISDPDLAGMAARHSASMAQSGRFETVDAQGNDILTRAAALGYGPADPSSGTLNLVENIYRIRLYSSAVTERKDGAAHTTFQWRSTEDLASQMVADWLKDDQQNRQILDEHFDRAGIGVAIGEQDRIFVTYNLARIEENAGEITLNSDDRPKLEPRALAERVHVLLNEARLEQGLVELLLDERLSTIAANHSQDMAEHGYFDHVNREDEGPTERAVRGGVKIHLDGENYTLKNEIGENLYRGRLFSGKKFELRDGARYATLLWLNFEELAQSVVQGLLQETSNRDNIFNQRFERQGIGIAIDRDDHLIFSQLFAMTEGLPDMQRYKVANPEKRPTIKIKQLTREIHRLVNQERAKRQLQPLSYDDDLAKIALKHSRDMAKNNYFAHKNAKGERAVDRARRGHYRTSQIMQGNVLRSGIGENLFRDRIYTGFRIIKNRSIEFRWNSLEELAQKVVDGWMSSQGHRGNMLNAFYQREGIGVVLDKNEQIYVTQNFF